MPQPCPMGSCPGGGVLAEPPGQASVDVWGGWRPLNGRVEAVSNVPKQLGLLGGRSGGGGRALTLGRGSLSLSPAY